MFEGHGRMFSLVDCLKAGYIIPFQYFKHERRKESVTFFGMFPPSSAATLERKMNVWGKNNAW